MVTGGGVDGSADGVDASGSSEGGAVDSVSVCVIAAEGEESGGVLSFASLHPAKVKQRIRDKNSGSKRFMMFTSLFFFFGSIYVAILLTGGGNVSCAVIPQSGVR